MVRSATILRKGGAHASPDSAKRRRHKHKQTINEELDLYFNQDKPQNDGAESDCPDHPAFHLAADYRFQHRHYSNFR